MAQIFTIYVYYIYYIYIVYMYIIYIYILYTYIIYIYIYIYGEIYISAVRCSVNVPNVSMVSKYPPNVIFLLNMQCKHKMLRSRLNEFQQYKTADVELAFAHPML